MSSLATRPRRAGPGGSGLAVLEHEIGPADIVRAVDTQDAVLVARMVAGDEEALSEVWHRHGSVVFGHARRMTGNAAIAEEVAQDVFVALWKNPERFDPARGTLRAYLGVHARRRAIDMIRQDSRRSNRELRHHTMNERRDCPDGLDDVTGMKDAVRQAIERLPEDQRRAVELAYFGGLTHCEIAVRLDIPEGTAKSRLRLAQAKLRDWLGPILQDAV
jgi:RNA polymerase sigma-70 factor (ECF subfamily)